MVDIYIHIYINYWHFSFILLRHDVKLTINPNLIEGCICWVKEYLCYSDWNISTSR